MLGPQLQLIVLSRRPQAVLVLQLVVDLSSLLALSLQLRKTAQATASSPWFHQLRRAV